MPTSQNGYPANDITLTKVWTIPGTTRRIRLRKDDAGYLLIHLAAWFDKYVENIDAGQLDDWGYAERPIRGGSQLSNHASGTAIDLNALKHPLGQRGTFTPAQAARIRARLRLYESVIRWGGDYRRRADEMHFEINKPLADVRRVAAKLRRSSSANTTISMTAIRKAVRGEPISATYWADARQFMAWATHPSIAAIPPTTRDAYYRTRDKRYIEYTVRRVQAKYGLRQDGIFGPVTAAVMKPYGYTILP